MSGGYVRLPHAMLDVGADGIVGHAAWAVFLRLRRYARATPPVQSVRRALGELRARGLVASYAASGKMARVLGASDDTVQRAVATLERAQWVITAILPGNHRAYVLGERDADNRERYLADEWLGRAIAGLPDELRRAWSEDAIDARRTLLVRASECMREDRTHAARLRELRDLVVR